MAKFNERLKLLRREAGLSQQDFAKQLGISKSSINMYERGKENPTWKPLKPLLIILMLIWIFFLENQNTEVRPMVRRY